MSKKITNLDLAEKLDGHHGRVLALADLLGLVYHHPDEVDDTTFWRVSMMIENEMKTAAKLTDDWFKQKRKDSLSVVEQIGT